MKLPIKGLIMKFPTALIIFFLPATLSAALKEQVNLQWAICDANPRDVLAKLGEGTANPYRHNPINYFDTDPPTYISDEIMFRTKTSHGEALSTIKVVFRNTTVDIPSWVRCLWNRYGDDITYTCEKRCPLRRNTSTVWCKKQVHFIERYRSINWKEMVAFGPYMDSKWKFHIGGYKVKFDDVVAEGLHLMEIEAQLPSSEGQTAFQKISEHLKARGVSLCDRQEGKTVRLFRALGYHVNDGQERHEL